MPSVPVIPQLRDIPQYFGSKFRGGSSPNGKLLLFVHGFLGDAVETWGDFLNLLGTAETKEFDSLFYQYSVNKSQVEILSQFLLDALSFVFEGALITELKKQGVNRSVPYKEVLISAHSLGAVIVRDALMRAVELKKTWIAVSASYCLLQPTRAYLNPRGGLLVGSLGLSRD
jgi:hypothetical protein